MKSKIECYQKVRRTNQVHEVSFTIVADKSNVTSGLFTLTMPREEASFFRVGEKYLILLKGLEAGDDNV